MPLTAGSRIGPYEVLAPLGAGGMGEVYRARDTRLDRIVAIKVLLSQVGDDSHARERFEREARAISALDHPHICALYDVGDAAGAPYLVMQYLEGETLAQRLAKGPLAFDVALSIAIEMAGALDHAHRAGIVHRDLKPGNVMLTKGGARLLDFGLARVAVSTILAGVSIEPTQAPLTARGTILGTIQYMAPEQLEGREADARADIWALGAVIYEMVAGRKAFAGASHASLISAIMSAPIRPLADATVAPPLLDALVRTCLAKTPDDRFQNAHDVLVALTWVRDGQAAAAPAATGRRLHRRWLWPSLVAASLAIGAVAGVLASRPPAAPLIDAIRFDIAPPDSARFATTHAIAPNGRQVVAVITDPAGRSHLWLRRLEATDAAPLAGTEDAAFPFWSPDSRSIGFFAGGKLKRLDLEAGAPLVVCDAPVGRGGAWMEDNQIVFAPSNNGPLMRVSAAGGEPAAFTTLAVARGEIGHRFPVPLPHGRFGYLVLTGTAAGSSFWAAPLTAPASAVQVVSSDASAQFAAGYLFFTRDATLVAQSFDAERSRVTGDPIPIVEDLAGGATLGVGAFSVSANGTLVFRRELRVTTRLFWYFRNGRPGEPVTPAALILDPALSPDGHRLAYVKTDAGASSLWVLDLARRTESRITTDAPSVTYPVWAPDGGRIVVSSRRGPGGNINLYDVPVAGGSLRPVLEAPAMMIAGGWTRTGDSLVWSQADVPPRSSLKMMGSDHRPVTLLDPGFTLTTPRVSPDGRWLAYSSNQSGRAEVYVSAFPMPGEPRQVSAGGGGFPRWRLDGRELFYISGGGTLNAVEVLMRKETIEFGSPVPLFTIVPIGGARVRAAQYDAAPDGQRFIVNIAQRSADDPLSVIIHWPALRHSR